MGMNMTRERNIKTARNVFRFFEQGKFKEFSEIIAENGKWIHPYHSGLFAPEVVGKKEILKVFKNMAANFDEIKFPIVEIMPFEDPNRVAVKMTGKLHLKNGGGLYENEYLAIFTFDEQGKIVEWIEYYNPITSARAFGLMDKLK